MLAAAVCFAKCEEAELVAGTWRYKAIRADFLRLLVERTVTVVARGIRADKTRGQIWLQESNPSFPCLRLCVSLGRTS